MLIYYVAFGLALFVAITVTLKLMERRRARKKIIEDRLFARSMWDKGL